MRINNYLVLGVVILVAVVMSKSYFLQSAVGTTGFNYQFYYTKGDMIGDERQFDPQPDFFIAGKEMFESGDLELTCGSDPELKVQESSSTCWDIGFSYEGINYEAHPNEKVILNNYLAVTPTATGKTEEKDDWIITYNFEFINKEWLDIEPVSIPNTQAEKNKPFTIPVRVYYDLTDEAYGTIHYKVISRLYYGEMEDTKRINLERGWNTYYFDFTPEVLGQNDIYIEASATVLPTLKPKTDKTVAKSFIVKEQVDECIPQRNDNTCGIDNCGYYYNNCEGVCVNSQCVTEEIPPDEPDEETDNTMIYVIGGVALVFLLILAMKKR